MAKIKLSPLVSKISGSTGPLLFSESRGVVTVRTKKTPTNPNTAAQQVSRAALRDLMSIFSQLHILLQGVWSTYGAGRGMTGVNAFLSQNLAAEQTGGEWSVSPPGTLPNLDVVGPVNGNCPGNALVNFTPSPITGTTSLIYYHRMGNQGDSVPPVMTRGFFASPRTSPVNIPLTNCADGDNWVYLYTGNSFLVDWSLGFGSFVDF
jgi:hypothetical protein